MSMQSLYTAGTRVRYQDALAIITPLPDDQIALSFEELDIKPHVMPLKEAEREFGKTLHLHKQRKVVTQQIDYSIADMVEIKRRKAYVDELLLVSKSGGPGGAKLRQSVIDRVKYRLDDPKGVSPAQLARWLETVQTHSLGVAATLRQPTQTRSSQFSDEVRDLALQAIDDYYLQPGCPNVQFAYDCYIDDVNEHLGEKIKRPCYQTFCYWVQSIHPIEAITQRHGLKAAREAKRNAVKKLVVDRILERVEVDAVNLAIGLRDENGNYLGLVTLFVAFDCRSRSVLGIQLQVGRGESAASVIDLYKHAIGPKGPGSYSLEALFDWPMYGLPEVIVSDGGAGFTAIKTQAFCLYAGTQTQIVEAGMGWKKPYIERFFGTLRQQFASTLSSYCGKYTDKRVLDASVREQASMTPAQFHDALTHWIVDEYHQSPHKGLGGNTPYQVWKKEAQIFPPMLPENYELIRHSNGDIRSRIIQGHKGVGIENMQYNDVGGRLNLIGMRLKEKGEEARVTTEYSPNDISSVTIVDPFTEETFQALAVDDRVREGMSLREFKEAYPTLKKNKGYGHSRVARKSAVIAAANKEHKKKLQEAKSRKSQSAHEDEVTDQVKTYQNDPQGDTAKGTAETSNTAKTANTDATKQQKTPKDQTETKGYDYD